MKFKWYKGLPFIAINLNVEGVDIAFENALIDTGAASSLFNIDKLLDNGLSMKETDIIVEMVGIGGTEHVFQREIGSVRVAKCDITKPTVQFGEMDYGFQIDGIIGSDLLSKISAVIDFGCDSINSASSEASV